MAQVTLPEYMQAISGKVGQFIFKSRQMPDGTTKVYMYENPYFGNRKVRKSPPSDKERAQRDLFARTNAEVRHRQLSGDKRPRAVIFREVYAELKQK